MSAAASNVKPRVGIVLTEAGISSEVWALRQAESFGHFEPVYFAFSKRTDGWNVPEDREFYLFGDEKPRHEVLMRRVQRKLGVTAGAFPVPKQLKAIRRTLQAARLDTVLCHFAWNGVAISAAATGLPLICHVHGRDVTANLQWPSNRRALVDALPKFKHVITVGRFQTEILKQLYPETKMSVVPCGAPTSLFASAPLPERAADAPVVFITVGRLSEEKGQLQTLEAFEMIYQTGVESRLVIVGDGPLLPQLRARIASSPAKDAVVLTGMLPPEEVAKQLSHAHIYLQHSRAHNGWIEGFGVTLTEAGAAGLPLIASNLGGIPDQVLPEQNGYLHAQDDVQAQAKFMRALASNEPKRLAMGATARRIAKSFDSEVMAARLEQEILSVL